MSCSKLKAGFEKWNIKSYLNDLKVGDTEKKTSVCKSLCLLLEGLCLQYEAMSPKRPEAQTQSELTKIKKHY